MEKLSPSPCRRALLYSKCREKSKAPPCTICRALSCAEAKREANPKRRREDFDDRAVLIASPAPQPRDRRESRQTGRSGGVARGGIGNHVFSGVLYPLLQKSAAARQHLSPPRDWGQPRLLRPRPQERRNRSRSPSEGDYPAPPEGNRGRFFAIYVV